MSSPSPSSSSSVPVSTLLSEQRVHLPASSESSSSPPAFERLVLGPNDWILPPSTTMSMLYFYQRPDHIPKEEFMPVSKLTTSLQRLLTHYPLLTGKWVKGPRGTLEIEGSQDAGVPFLSFSADCSLSELPLSESSMTTSQSLPASLKLVHPWDTFDYSDPISNPLFGVQHTKFKCGGVCLGIYMGHYVGDAEAYFNLVRDWAELYRNGGEKLEHPPSWSREFLIPSEEEVQQRLQQHVEPSYIVPEKHVNSDPVAEAAASLSQTNKKEEGEGETTPAAANEIAQTTLAAAPAANIMRIFRFTTEELAAIKAAAAPKDNNSWVSGFEAFTAHLERCILKARFPSDGAQPPHEVKLAIATNFRKRVKHLLPMPDRFFGNAALWTTKVTPTAQLLTNSLPDNATLVHEALQFNDGKQLLGTMAWITAQPDRSAIIWNYDLSKDFMLTQWNKMSMYDALFEADCPPMRVALPHVPGPAGAAMLMGTPREGEVDVWLGLKTEEMKRLEADTEFRQFRTKEGQQQQQ